MMAPLHCYWKARHTDFAKLFPSLIRVFNLLWERKMPEKSINRRPAVAGMFYPASPEELRTQISTFLKNAKTPSIHGQVLAIVSPHAGYMYSGQVAAYGYKTVQGKSFDLVVVISPSHRAYFKGASVYAAGDYLTPLGIAKVDRGACEALLSQGNFIQFHPQVHEQEHAVEVQVPFLQSSLTDFKLLPVIMGSQDFASCERLKDALLAVIEGKKTLIVASSDLSHYHPDNEARSLDHRIVKAIEHFDPEELNNLLSTGKSEACGGGPIITAMLMASSLGARHARVLTYANSGDVTGDRQAVVGYLSAVFYKNGENKAKEKVGVDLGLSEEEKKILHTIARDAIESRLNGKPLPPLPPLTPTLEEYRGAFVTLKTNGNLRGCIGLIKPVKSLASSVQEMAIAAAFQDPRFPPLSKDEWPSIEIEISALTPFVQIEDLSEIEIGTHGLYIQKGPYSGLLLPQVATEYKWDREEFLQQTCIKAGLHPMDYKDPEAKIYTFSADIF